LKITGINIFPESFRPKREPPWLSLRDEKIKTKKKKNPGTDVMIFKIFSPKISSKKLAFFTQNKAKLCKILIITLVLEKNANFFAEN
jgi:hypothetical protein